MWAVIRSRRHWPKVLPLALCFMAVSVAACSDDETTGPNPPVAFNIAVEAARESVRVSWTAQADVDSFVVAISSNPTFTRTVDGAQTIAVFTSADGVEDGTDYTASATAYNAGGVAESSNTPMVTTKLL